MALQIPNEDRIYNAIEIPEELANDKTFVNAIWIMNMFDKLVNGQYATKSFQILESVNELPEIAEAGQTAYVVDDGLYIFNGEEWEKFNRYNPLYHNGVYFPHTDADLKKVFQTQSKAIIDFSMFDKQWDSNGYNLDEVEYTFKNIDVYSDPAFPWFQKTLFSFNNSNVVFENCTLIVENIDCNNRATLYPILKFSTDNYNANYNEFLLDSSNISVRTPINVNASTKVVAVEVKDCKVLLEKSYCYNIQDSDANVQDGILFKINNSNEINDPEKTRIMSNYSMLTLANFHNSAHCIQYTNLNSPSRVVLNHSQARSDYNDDLFSETIIMPNQSEIFLYYTNASKVSCVESDEEFTDWEINTQYEEGDLLVWTHPDDENNKRYFRVLQQFTTSDDPYEGGFWQALDHVDGNDEPDPYIEWYYSTYVSGNCYAAFDNSGKISIFERGGALQSWGIEVEHLNVNSEDYRLPIWDVDLDSDNVRDAIKEITQQQIDYYETAEIINQENIEGDITINTSTYLSNVADDVAFRTYHYDGVSDWLDSDDNVVDLDTLGIDVSGATIGEGSSFEVYSVSLDNKTSFTVADNVIVRNKGIFLNGKLLLKKDYSIENKTISFNDYTLRDTDSISIL